MNTAYELFLSGLRDMLNAENKLVHVLGEQERETKRDDLRQAFEQHRHQTSQHAARLVDVFRLVGETPEQADCKGIDGLKEEKLELMKKNPSQDLLDFINVAAGIKVERYEMSAYDALILLAREMGLQHAADLLKQNRNEEEETEKKLQELIGLVKPQTTGIELDKPDRSIPEGGLPRKAA